MKITQTQMQVLFKINIDIYFARLWETKDETKSGTISKISCNL